MKKRSTRQHVAALAGSAFITTIGVAGLAAAEEGKLFVADQLDGGYQLAAKSDAEGKCGEGKCGGASDAKADAEGKCGGASDAKADAEGKCGGASDAKADAEGKCGGASDAKAGAEGKCGEGKCGGSA